MLQIGYKSDGRSRVKNKMFKTKCKYWKICNSYQEGSPLCNEDAGSWEFDKKCNIYSSIHDKKCDMFNWIRAIVGVLFGIFLLSLSSAYYAGDTIIIGSNLTNPVYAISGNTSEINLNITYENGTITIFLPYDINPDDFTILFLDNLTKEVIKEVIVNHGGGGGGGSRIVYKNVTQNVTIEVPKIIEKIVTTPCIDNCSNITIIEEIQKPSGTSADELFIIDVLIVMVLIGIVSLISKKIYKDEVKIEKLDNLKRKMDKLENI